MADSTIENDATPPRSKWPRYLLLLVITIAFFFLNQPLNLASIFVFFMLVLGTPVFEFLYVYIDNLEPSLLKLLSINKKLPTRAKRYLSSLKETQKREENKKRLGRIYTIVITLIFAGELLYPVTHDFLASQVSFLNDSLCVSNMVNIQLTCDDGLGVEPYSADDGTIFLGLINQGGPFDHSALNGPEQQIETLIFHENATACANPNHITLAVVTMLSRTVNDITLSAQVGLDDLHGVYLAQKDYNSDKQHQTKLCLVIGNAGTSLMTAQTVPLVLERVVRYAKHDPTFRGIVGFPFSGAAQKATETLKAWRQTDIPLVSPSASSDLLNNIPNFYRVVSSNQPQSEAMVQFLEQGYQTQQHPTISVAVFGDSQNAYSQSLSYDFIQNVNNDRPNIHTIPESYQVQNPASLDEPLKDALQQKANFIYFAGYAYDLDSLEEKLQAYEGPSMLPIPILGGDGLYDLSRYISSTYSIVYSTVYASPIATTDQFVSEYEQFFGPTLQRTAAQAQYALLPPHTILAYDATTAYLKALDGVLSRGEDPTQANMNASLATVSFTGKSGSITFYGNGPMSSNPLAKPIYVLCADRDHILHEAAQLPPGQPGQFLLKNIADCT